jgi:hypothetical protein
MLLIGLMPVVIGLALFWSIRDTYAVVFRMNTQAAIVLAALVAIDLTFIVTGVWLVRGRTLISN